MEGISNENPFPDKYPNLKLPPGRLTETDAHVLHKYASGKWVELGTFLGRSAIILALKCDKVVTIDHFQFDDVPPGENNQDSHYQYKTVKAYMPPNIKLIKGDADTISARYKDKSFDGAFIDASHEYKDVLSNAARWLPKIKDDGIVIFHDYHKQWPDVVRAVDELVAEASITTVKQAGWCFVGRKL